MRLNLGSGGAKLPGWTNVDCETFENPDVVCDLGREIWPWRNSSVDEARASHLLEHLPGESFFHFLRELYRVLKPNAPVHLILPWPRHDIFLNDPTHVRAVMPATMVMFSRKYIRMLAEQGKFLTDFGARNKIDFELDPKILYKFSDGVDTNDPELAWKAAHLNNIIFEWHGTMRAIK